MSSAICTTKQTCRLNFDNFVAGMWLFYCRAPGRETAPGEPVDLGEIGATPEKSWGKAYALQFGQTALEIP